MDKIILKEIRGYKGYKAGSDGNIYSFLLLKNKGYDYQKRPKILKQAFDGRGNYLHVVLFRNCIGYSNQVHSLICEAFNGKRPKGYWVSHENGNSVDNKPTNLKWRTPSENQKLKIIHGTDDRGIKSSRAKFNSEQVKLIRSSSKAGLTYKEIAKKFDVHEMTIGKIVRKERYK